MNLQPDGAAGPSDPSLRDGALLHHYDTQTYELLCVRWTLKLFWAFGFLQVHSALNELQ